MFRKGSVLLWTQDNHHGNLDSTDEAKGEVLSGISEQGTDKKLQNPREGVKDSETSLSELVECVLELDGGKCVKDTSKKKTKRTLLTAHEDIIGDSFWTKYPNILQ